ncbi:hypothetical protein SVAN01_02263 [Stagonosporopsis vannaccii]|nr:hypothetical protein SVAN01_02263 [Stagonosporopsis vannaccii]
MYSKKSITRACKDVKSKSRVVSIEPQVRVQAGVWDNANATVRASTSVTRVAREICALDGAQSVASTAHARTLRAMLVQTAARSCRSRAQRQTRKGRAEGRSERSGRPRDACEGAGSGERAVLGAPSRLRALVAAKGSRQAHAGRTRGAGGTGESSRYAKKRSSIAASAHRSSATGGRARLGGCREVVVVSWVGHRTRSPEEQAAARVLLAARQHQAPHPTCAKIKVLWANASPALQLSAAQPVVAAAAGVRSCVCLQRHGIPQRWDPGHPTAAQVRSAPAPLRSLKPAVCLPLSLSAVCCLPTSSLVEPRPSSLPGLCICTRVWPQSCSSQRAAVTAPYSIALSTGRHAVLDPACAPARPRRERAAAHSGDIVRPSCASDSVREPVEQCHSLHALASCSAVGRASSATARADAAPPLFVVVNTLANGHAARKHHPDVCPAHTSDISFSRSACAAPESGMGDTTAPHFFLIGYCLIPGHNTPSQRSGLAVNRDTARDPSMTMIDAVISTSDMFDSARNTATLTFDVFIKTKQVLTASITPPR